MAHKRINVDGVKTTNFVPLLKYFVVNLFRLFVKRAVKEDFHLKGTQIQKKLKEQSIRLGINKVS